MSLQFQDGDSEKKLASTKEHAQSPASLFQKRGRSMRAGT